MSWSEMEKELSNEHSVPPEKLRKVRLVSELQGLLEFHRTQAEATSIIVSTLQVRPPRHHSVGSEASTEFGSGSDEAASGADSPVPQPKRRRAASIDEQQAIQSLLLVAPRAAEPKSKSSAAPQLVIPETTNPNNTPLQRVRELDPPGKQGPSIDPALDRNNMAPVLSPGRMNTASILIGKLGGREGLGRVSPPRSENGGASDGQPSKIGVYTPRSRKSLLNKFHAKRQRRVWRRQVRYDCRKSFANNRIRVKGRFVKKKADDPSSYLLQGQLAEGKDEEGERDEISPKLK